jgi:hypothetical protein
MKKLILISMVLSSVLTAEVSTKTEETKITKQEMTKITKQVNNQLVMEEVMLKELQDNNNDISVKENLKIVKDRLTNKYIKRLILKKKNIKNLPLSKDRTPPRKMTETEVKEMNKMMDEETQTIDKTTISESEYSEKTEVNKEN